MNNTSRVHKKSKNIFFKIFILAVSIMFAYKIIMGESNVFTIVKEFLTVLKPIFFAMIIAYILYRKKE